MTRAEAKKFIDQVFNDVWNPINIDKIPEYYHEDINAYMGETHADYQDIINRALVAKANFTHLENDIKEVLVDENKITVRLEQKCIPQLDVEASRFSIILIYEVVAGKIKTVWSFANRAMHYKEVF